MSCVISIDPGKYKCGLVLADIGSGLVLEGKVVLSEKLLELVVSWQDLFPVAKIVLGNGTSSKYWKGLLSELGNVQIVDEEGSTMRARFRYWELWPPSKWICWIPRGLLLPPKNIDAVAALILLEDYLGRKLILKESEKFKILLEQ